MILLAIHCSTIYSSVILLSIFQMMNAHSPLAHPVLAAKDTSRSHVSNMHALTSAHVDPHTPIFWHQSTHHKAIQTAAGRCPGSPPYYIPSLLSQPTANQAIALYPWWCASSTTTVMACLTSQFPSCKPFHSTFLLSGIVHHSGHSYIHSTLHWSATLVVSWWYL